jgi:hypothetical protein
MFDNGIALLYAGESWLDCQGEIFLFSLQEF